MYKFCNNNNLLIHSLSSSPVELLKVGYGSFVSRYLLTTFFAIATMHKPDFIFILKGRGGRHNEKRKNVRKKLMLSQDHQKYNIRLALQSYESHIRTQFFFKNIIFLCTRYIISSNHHHLCCLLGIAQATSVYH